LCFWDKTVDFGFAGKDSSSSAKLRGDSVFVYAGRGLPSLCGSHKKNEKNSEPSMLLALVGFCKHLSLLKDP